MAKTKTFKQEVQKALSHRQGYGRSKHEDKKADKAYIKSLGDRKLDRAELREKYYFHDRSTYEATVNRAVDVLKHVKDIEGRRIPFSEVTKEHLEKYIDHEKERALKGEISPRTLAKERSQVSKAFNVDLTHVEILPCTAESQKGRGSDRHWNPENHKEQMDFYRMTGARKGEYHNLSKQEKIAYSQKLGVEIPTDMHGRASNLIPHYTSTGAVDRIVVIHAKHGKTNFIQIHPDNQEKLGEIFRSGKYQEYFNPSDHCNVHACRREYAQQMYEYYKRDLNTLTEKELYRCRDGSHRVYDREAVSKVAESLGHAKGDLFDTIHNYLR